MGKEIERKFLLKQLPGETAKIRPLSIQQGYLAIEENGNEIRVRKANDQFFLTVKSKGNLERTEVELNITKTEFDQLWPLTEGRQIKKNRYVLQKGAYAVEIDEFKGKLKGLFLAEIEFPHIEAAHQFQPLAWMGKEVTHLGRFKNKQLSKMENLLGLKELNQ